MVSTIKNNKIVVFLSLFGYTVYAIEVCDYDPSKLPTPYCFTFFDNHLTRPLSLSYSTMQAFQKAFQCALRLNSVSIDYSTGEGICFDNEISRFMLLAQKAFSYAEEVDPYDQPISLGNSTIFKNFQSAQYGREMSFDFLKRFCAEKKTDFLSNGQIDPKSDNPLELMLVYLVYQYGMNPGLPRDDEEIKKLLMSLFGELEGNGLNYSSEKMLAAKNHIMASPGYPLILRRGLAYLLE